MKRFFKGVGKLLWRHKLLSLICLCAFAIVLIMLYVFCSIFIGSSGKYGHRLDGIKEVQISKKELSSVTSSIKKSDNVNNASVRIEGKIVYVDIEYNKDTNKDKAKEIANEVLKEFSDDEKGFYDFEFILFQKTDDDKGFKLTGTKSPKNDKISWIKS